MHTANLELSKTLWELSGWSDTYLAFNNGHKDDVIRKYNTIDGLPAYDLGFMLRKLPRKLNGVNSKQRDGNFNLYASRGKTAWVASYADADGTIIRRLKKDAESQNNRNFWFIHRSADTPEDACAQLLCELIRQKVITV